MSNFNKNSISENRAIMETSKSFIANMQKYGTTTPIVYSAISNHFSSIYGYIKNQT